MATPLPKLPAPAQRALASVGVQSLEDLTARSQAEVAALHGMGPRALAALNAALESHGLSFKP